MIANHFTVDLTKFDYRREAALQIIQNAENRIKLCERAIDNSDASGIFPLRWENYSGKGVDGWSANRQWSLMVADEYFPESRPMIEKMHSTFIKSHGEVYHPVFVKVVTEGQPLVKGDAMWKLAQERIDRDEEVLQELISALKTHL